jgi:hypothetical protein
MSALQSASSPPARERKRDAMSSWLGNQVHEMDALYLGLARTIYIRCIYGTFGRELPNIQSFTVNIYGSGQPYLYPPVNSC